MSILKPIIKLDSLQNNLISVVKPEVFMLSCDNSEEKFNCYTHFYTAFLSIIGTFVLIIVSLPSIVNVLLSTVYGITTTYLFFASGMWHKHKVNENQNDIYAKLDIVGIFFMIAGTFTPIAIKFVSPSSAIAFIIIEWTLAIIGSLVKFFLNVLNKYILTAVYLLMGWIGMLSIKTLYMNMMIHTFIFLLIGGLFYSFGAIIYVRKNHKYSHEIWHIFVIIGAIFHFFVVYSSISLQ